MFAVHESRSAHEIQRILSELPRYPMKSSFDDPVEEIIARDVVGVLQDLPEDQQQLLFAEFVRESREWAAQRSLPSYGMEIEGTICVVSAWLKNPDAYKAALVELAERRREDSLFFGDDSRLEDLLESSFWRKKIVTVEVANDCAGNLKTPLTKERMLEVVRSTFEDCRQYPFVKDINMEGLICAVGLYAFKLLSCRGIEPISVWVVPIDPE